MSSGYNGLITTDTAGTYKVRVEEISQPATIISKEGKGRSRRVYYPIVTSTSSFDLSIVFPSWAAREKFNIWMSRFMEKTVNGRGFKAAVQVDVPSRDFSRTGIPTGPLSYGEGLTDVAYPLTVEFTGASDPLEISLEEKRARSYFVPPKKGRSTSTYFYPAGRQLSGAGALDENIYDNEFVGPVIPNFGPEVPAPIGPMAPDEIDPNGNVPLNETFPTGVFSDSQENEGSP